VTPLLLLALFLQDSFTNPLLPSGPDPWVTFKNGFYYYTASSGRNLTLTRARSLADLKTAEKKVVWTPPAEGAYSKQLWAPELHHLRGKWYLYFAADDGPNRNHRMWVLENPAENPLEGQWTLKGKLADPADKWAIDGTVLDLGNRLYFAWSGWPGDANGTQSIYFAELENPWTLKGRRVLLSTPEFPWELAGDLHAKRDPEQNPGLNLDDPLHVSVNEGPVFLTHGDDVFLIYSANGCWTDHYALGLLSAKKSANLLDPKSWTKSKLPVFWGSPAAGVYAPGHNSFFTSPDGSEHWILYHANPKPGAGCGGQRAPHMQRFSFGPDGFPVFGRPVPASQPQPRPSGDPR